MNLRRVSWVAAIAVITLLSISCGQVYRPVVIPVSVTPPNAANFHSVFGINANVSANPGSALEIDVSGDTNIGVASMGMNPTHAASTPGNGRVFVASAGSLSAGQSDVVTAFTPARQTSIATGLGTPVTFTFPNVGPIDPSTGKPEWFCPYRPDFVATTQNSAVYVANFGFQSAADAAGCAPNLNLQTNSTDSVAVLNPANSTFANIAYLPAGAHPVAMAETSNSANLYVVNQGNGTVTDLSPTDLSTIATIAVGNTPVWAVARVDNQRVYVLTQGDGKLVSIDTATNSVLASLPVGAGANFILYDPHLNRLYVTNPAAAAVFVFNATTDPPTPLGSATGAVSVPVPPIPANTPPCTPACSYSSVMPVSVAALPDGSRFYVASYVTAAAGSPCPDPNLVAAGCVIPQVTVFDAPSLTVKSTVFPLLPPVANPVSAVQPFALAPSPFCVPVLPYAPGTARFRLFAAAAVDSSRVYASICDAGSIADINTTTTTISTGSNNAPDQLVTDIVAPFSAGAPGSNNEPPPQNPIFLLTGQ